MSTTFYQVKATRAIPITVDYVCEHCGHANTNDSQMLDLAGYSRLSVFSGMTDSRKAQALDDLRMYTRRVVYDMEMHRYKKFTLTCACSHCGKRQSWSSYHAPSRLYSTLCLLGLVGIPSVGVVSAIKENGWAILFLLLPPLLIAPQVYTMYCNYQANRKTAQLDDKYLPRITFRDAQVAQIAQEVLAEREKSGAERDYIPIHEQEWQDAKRAPGAGEWKCPSCWRMNKDSVTICDCGSEKPRQ